MCGTNQGKTRKTCENQENSHPKIAKKMYIKCARNVDINTKENKDKINYFYFFTLLGIYGHYMYIICTFNVHTNVHLMYKICPNYGRTS